MARHLAVFDLLACLLTVRRGGEIEWAAQFPERRRAERELASLQAKAKANGFTLVPDPRPA